MDFLYKPWCLAGLFKSREVRGRRDSCIGPIRVCHVCKEWKSIQLPRLKRHFDRTA
ncbi:hypothetical protein HYC85_028489 [Camellia sinensis]|uniref:Uncharacterized protein n=1 Tax=Camellia sinensis TaxID=4442 RepID=A0A7J7FXI1_CAMSI|nr:hypothetical protein HYC85_028489 [Camellia sinensis]